MNYERLYRLVSEQWVLGHDATQANVADADAGTRI